MGELAGFLSGLISDKTITAKDLIYLSAWLKEQEVLSSNEILNQVQSLVNSALHTNQPDSKLENELINEFQILLKKIVHLYEGDFNLTDKTIGVLRGISADDTITNSELVALNKWLKEHKDVKGNWPFNEINEKLDCILSGEKITDEQKKELLSLLKKATGNSFYETGSAQTIPVSLSFDNCDEIEFRDKHVCFSGKFASGNRNECEEKAMLNGAHVEKRVGQGLNYLIIGDDISRDWKHTAYGNKILKAIELKKKGFHIKIISESDFLKNISSELVVEQAEIVKPKKSKATKLKYPPQFHFKDWAFDIHEHYWDLLGVSWRERIDTVKAKPLREKRKLDLLIENPSLDPKKAQSIAVKEIRPKTGGWALIEPVSFGFSEGYLFNHKTEKYSVQILGFDADRFILLFFDQNTKKYIKLAEIDFKGFVDFLEKGDQTTLIDRNIEQLPESRMKYEIKKHLSGS